MNELAALFGRDLNKLMEELRAYPDEASLWRVQGDIANPAGTLALHLLGNLNHFIGHLLGGVAFQRDRDAEFSRRNVPRKELLAELEKTRNAIESALSGLDERRLSETFPGQWPPAMQGASTRAFLLHLYGHLNWHLGQVNYHRRMLSR